MITCEMLKRVLEYDPKTGRWTWIGKNAPQSHVHVGDSAGCANGSGHWQIRVYGKTYVASRLAWLWMTGSWPNGDVDHRDVDPTNDRWENLRDATRSQNSANQRVRKNNTSGLKGVNFDKSTGKYLARLRIKGKRICVALSECPAAAYLALVVETERHNGEFARMR